MAMEEGALSCLLRSRPVLEQDIKASYLMDHMVSDGVLSRDEEERIRSKDNRAYVSFYNALVRESYGDLANLLHRSLPLGSPEAQRSFADGGTPRVQSILREGGVPQRPVVFVQRTELLKQLREQLYRLHTEPGWVVLYGMPGSGKSILAAEALDRVDLLARIQVLCFRLEQSQQDLPGPGRTPGSLDEAKERLRFVMLRRYPRDRSIADSVNGIRHEVEVESGMDEDKALEILALYVNVPRQKLPEQARSIVQLCKGFPLVVSLLFGVSSANEWKSFDVKALFPDSEEVEVHVKCTTWSPDGTRVICADSSMEPSGENWTPCTQLSTWKLASMAWSSAS
ncbi:hypothetical protein CRUP_026255 [Coryphaenoides rupestris]|nr:hypothetical protein CRUP_026255 [Coryphaenoides rupestris]